MLLTESQVQCCLVDFPDSSPVSEGLADTLPKTHLTLDVNSSQGGSGVLTKDRTVLSVLKTAEFNNNKGECPFLKTTKQLFQQIPVSKEDPHAGTHISSLSWLYP